MISINFYLNTYEITENFHLSVDDLLSFNKSIILIVYAVPHPLMIMCYGQLDVFVSRTKHQMYDYNISLTHQLYLYLAGILNHCNDKFVHYHNTINLSNSWTPLSLVHHNCYMEKEIRDMLSISCTLCLLYTLVYYMSKRELLFEWKKGLPYVARKMIYLIAIICIK